MDIVDTIINNPTTAGMSTDSGYVTSDSDDSNIKNIEETVEIDNTDLTIVTKQERMDSRFVFRF